MDRQDGNVSDDRGFGQCYWWKLVLLKAKIIEPVSTNRCWHC